MPDLPDCLCDRMTEFVDEGRVVDVTYLNFNNAFSRVAYNILLSKLGNHSLVVEQLGELTTGWMIRLSE